MKNLIGFLAVAVLIILMSGIYYPIDPFENGKVIVNLVVGVTYFLGFYSLYLIHTIKLSGNPQRRSVLLFIGALMGFMLAYFSLEIMFILRMK